MKRVIKAASTLADFEIDDGVLVKYNGDDKDVVIPNSVTSIGEFAFYHCTNLTSIMIPDSVTSIDEHAFALCSALESITIPDSVPEIGDGAFFGCTGLTSVTIGNGVTSIGGGAFANCYKLTSITIPNSVTSIGDHAFYRCKGLTSVTIPDSVTSIGDHAFDHCPKLNNVIIPDSVKSIGEEAFGSPQDSAQTQYTLNDVLQYLKDAGIDTTKHRYELKAEDYGSGTGSQYTYRFTALGDWMAYLSMKLHRSMTKSDVLDYLNESLDDLPTTLEGMLEFATENWWGDGDDFIISLKNIDTSVVLYSGDNADGDYEEDDDWDE